MRFVDAFLRENHVIFIQYLKYQQWELHLVCSGLERNQYSFSLHKKILGS